MTIPVPVNLAVEDDLSELLLRVLIRQVRRDFVVDNCYSHGGFGYIKRKISGFNNAARFTPFIVLTDLDQAECAPKLIEQWLTQPQHPNLMFRIAVHEVEAWVMADRAAFAQYLGVYERRIPQDVDSIRDPKRYLVDLARQSRSRELRESLVPRANSTAPVGPDYNGALMPFVDKDWHLDVATRYSASPKRTIQTLKNFEPM